GRESLPEHREVRERQARSLHEATHEEVVSLNFLATRFQCSLPCATLVMLCDGRIVGGFADPYGKLVLGDARAASVHEIWIGPAIGALRSDMNAGGSKFCGDCALKLPLKKDDVPAVRPIDAASLPPGMYVECTAASNILCAHASCALVSG